MRQPVDKIYGAIIDYNAFYHMLSLSLSGNKNFPLNDVISQWWESAFPKKRFNNIPIDDAVVLIRFQLIYNGCKKNKLKMDDKFLESYDLVVKKRDKKTIEDCKKYLIIKNLESRITTEKSITKKIKSKKLGRVIRRTVCELIVGQKHTDQQIMRIASVPKRMVNKMRSEINLGLRSDFKKPETPYKMIIK